MCEEWKKFGKRQLRSYVFVPQAAALVGGRSLRVPDGRGQIRLPQQKQNVDRGGVGQEERKVGGLHRLRPDHQVPRPTERL